MKLSGSFNLVGSSALFRILKMHSSVSTIVSNSVNSFLLAIISFMYLAYFGIPYKTSIRGKLICTYFRSSINFWKHLSSFLFFNFWGKRGWGLGIGVASSLGKLGLLALSVMSMFMPVPSLFFETNSANGLPLLVLIAFTCLELGYMFPGKPLWVLTFTVLAHCPNDFSRF